MYVYMYVHMYNVSYHMYCTCINKKYIYVSTKSYHHNNTDILVYW